MNALAKKSSRLIDELNKLALAESVNELALVRLKLEAEELLRSDRSGAFMVLGAISSLLRDEKAMHRYHRSALDWADDRVLALFNYGNSMAWMGDYSGALELSKMSYELAPNTRALDLMIRSALSLGLNGLVRKLLDEWKKLTGEEHELENEEPYAGEIRENIMNLLEEDMENHAELWKSLAKV